MNNLVLNVNGLRFDGWTAISVEKSLFNMVGAFGISGTDIFPGNFQKWGFHLGDECKIEIDNQTIINGYIEDIPITYDAEEHNIQIGGRDKTGDLVDCSFIEADQEWKNQSIFWIVSALCDPFGITVFVDDSVSVDAAAPIDTFKAKMGMTIFEIIKPLLDTKGILPISYGDGKLTLTRAGTTKANDKLELGKNIKSGSINQSIRDRFRTYVVKGQDTGNDWKTDTDVFVGPEGTYIDKVITRYRPTIILPDMKVTAADCKKKAKWEADNRAGQSVSIEYQVQGWTQSNGQVWPLNSLVPVKDKFLGINSEMLIAATAFSIDNVEGKNTILTLVDPKTFEVDPLDAIIKTDANDITAGW